jgi:ABC-type branched-subunit amino acid transport system substrate-binding protein
MKRLTLVLIIPWLCLINPFGVKAGRNKEGHPSLVLTEGSIKVGVILPSKGPLAETGAAMRDVLAAYFDNINSSGGIYNRKVELRIPEMGDDATSTAANAKRLIQEEQLFAMVGGISAGADKEVAALARDEKIPFIGPATLLPQTGPLFNRYVFYLLPGVSEQARALLNFAARKPELKKSRVAVVYSEGELMVAASTAIEEQAKKSGWSSILKHGYPRGNLNAAQLVKTLKQEGTDLIFFFGTSGDDVTFIKEAAAANWTPNIFLLGVFTGSGLPRAVPLAFKDKIFLSFPTVPTDITPAGTAEFRALYDKYKFTPRHTASQLTAVAAAKVFVEGLRLAGKELNREKLITALEGVHDYDTGVTPRITFGPDRRIGAKGAHIITINPEKAEFATASDWITVD